MTPSGRSGARRPRPKRVKPRSKGLKRADISLIVQAPRWRTDARAIAQVRRAARETLAMYAKTRQPQLLTILLGDDAQLKELNALFRGQHKATNVLSFPGEGKNYLGDVAIAFGMTSREARAHGKRLSAHAAHLAAHGVLHLLGYDHESERDAKIMEKLEARIMARLGLPDPYAHPREAA
jgi:probable rRNA maturation factor